MILQAGRTGFLLILNHLWEADLNSNRQRLQEDLEALEEKRVREDFQSGFGMLRVDPNRWTLVGAPWEWRGGKRQMLFFNHF